MSLYFAGVEISFPNHLYPVHSWEVPGTMAYGTVFGLAGRKGRSLINWNNALRPNFKWQFEPNDSRLEKPVSKASHCCIINIGL